MARRLVKYYFSFGSPYAALADTRIDALVEEAAADLLAIPLLAPPSDPPEGIAALLHGFKFEYASEDTARWARRLGLQWTGYESLVDARDATVGYYFAQESGRELPYRKAIFRAQYSVGRDIGERGVLAECARAAGLDGRGFSKALDEQDAYRDEFAAAARSAFDDRVFGVPLFVIDGERFWGNDRLDFLAEALAH